MAVKLAALVLCVGSAAVAVLLILWLGAAGVITGAIAGMAFMGGLQEYREASDYRRRMGVRL